MSPDDSLAQAPKGSPSPNSEVQETERSNVVLEHCPKCDALLDVTGCCLLTETSCPACGNIIRVLKQFHHFALMNELGRGGTGTVYRAFDESLERDVALKLLRSEYFNDPEFLANLESEAAITASISHPNVVQVYSAGRKNNFYYIAMENVTGGSLAERLAREGPMTEAEVFAIGIQTAQGLQAAYERGLLHRDVKPGNLLFADRDTIKVADFGLAIRVEQATGDSADIWGTPDYIAPEKLLQEGEDERSDIYSLGCTLFHCLTGCTPFGTQKLDQLIACKMHQSAPHLQQLAPNVSAAMAFVIGRCLERDPANRCQSYHELIERLEYAREQVASKGSESRLPQAQPTSPAPKSAGPRQRLIWGAVAVVALAAAVAGAFGLARRHEPAPSETSRPGASIAPSQIPVSAPQLRVPPAQTSPQFRELDLRPFCTVDSRKGIFSGPKMPDDTLEFAKYGSVTANGVPFMVVDPAQTPSGYNVLAFKGKDLPFPSTAAIDLARESVRKLHFLGIAGWGWPATPGGKVGKPILRLTVFHSNQQNEIFEFKNGVEFANHKTRVDAPGSIFADGILTNGHQVRTFSVALQNDAPVTSLSFESLDPVVAPVLVAITAELAR